MFGGLCELSWDWGQFYSFGCIISRVNTGPRCDPFLSYEKENQMGEHTVTFDIRRTYSEMRCATITMQVSQPHCEPKPGRGYYCWNF